MARSSSLLVATIVLALAAQLAHAAPMSLRGALAVVGSSNVTAAPVQDRDHGYYQRDEGMVKQQQVQVTVPIPDYHGDHSGHPDYPGLPSHEHYGGPPSDDTTPASDNNTITTTTDDQLPPDASTPVDSPPAATPAAPPAPSSPSPSSSSSAAGGDDGPTEVERWLVHYTNQLRASSGKPAQCGNLKLLRAARVSAQKQAECNEMAHTTCDGATPESRINAQGYQWSSLAENVAMNGHCGDTPQACAQTFVNQWKESPPHYDNIMSDNLMVGMSMATSGSGDYATQVFGNSGDEQCDFNVD